MKRHIPVSITAFFLSAMLSFPLGCSKSQDKSGEIRHYPVESLEGLVNNTGIEFDKDVSSDGNGSLRIKATIPSTIPLYETGDVDVDNTRLEYRAMIKTMDFHGRVFLEMWCRFQGKGEYFSRDLGSPVVGSTDWTDEMTPFFLKKGENPENVKLNLVIDGTGTVWVDDIRLVKTPLG